MKRKGILLKVVIALFITLSVNAQQGFGTSNPAPSSVIDMVSSNKGALLPRIALTNTTVAAPVSSPANALTVFNTATTGDVIPGYYYWSSAGSKWIRMTDANTPIIETDGVIGNEVTTATTNGGLTRTGSGTSADPYTLGLASGSASGQLMTWNGTAWAPSAAPANTNIYNANGALTSARTLTNNGFDLTFLATNQSSAFSAAAGFTQRGLASTKRSSVTLQSDDNNSDSVASNMYLFQDPENLGQVTVSNDSRGLNIGSTATTQAAPITFTTSAGSNAAGTEKMRITGAGNVGIGTSAPASSAILDLTSTNKALLLTRVSLTSTTDAVTVPSPVAGMMVFNLATTGSNETAVKANTVYYWDGTKWNELKGAQATSQTGSSVYKTKYRGRNLMVNSYPKPTLTVPETNLEFRFADNPTDTNRLQVRLTSVPATNVSVYVTGLWAGQSNSGSYYDIPFTPANYNVWQNIDTRSWSGIWSYYFVIATNEVRATSYNPSNYVMNLYGLCGWGNGWGPTNEPYSLAAEVF